MTGLKKLLKKGALPKTLNQALIICLPKWGEPANKCENMKPISLLNSDLKTVCKLLARWIQKILPYIINKEQNGFVSGRRGFHNVRRVLNVLYYKKKKEEGKNTSLLSLDIEKALDRVEGPYLFMVPEKFGI